MIKAKLINCTPSALDLLLRTKNTRLKNDDSPENWCEEKKQEHLDYMLDTIKSSWEFVDYIFEIEGVSRNFTHQFVRTRTGTYAEQSMRSVDASENDIYCPDEIHDNEGLFQIWCDAIATSMSSYSALIDCGAQIQNARGLLPGNIETSIMAKFNLRTLSDMAKTRLCVRTQGEYQDVFRAMRLAILDVHPWAEPFLEVNCISTGLCAFPRYGKEHCPFYDQRMDLTELKNDTKQKFWSARHYANPIAKNGKSM